MSRRPLVRAVLVVAILGFSPMAFCQSPAARPANPGVAVVVRLTPSQLDQLAAPVALYPDVLLAQILPASTHPLDVVTAFQWLRANPTPSEDMIAAETWDPSVQALAHYPSVLQLLADNVAWTQQLGRAYATQPADLDLSIQRLRAKARAAGSLMNTPQQNVYVANNCVQIVPTDPTVIYVPVYDPSVSFTHRRPPRFEKPRPSGPLHHHEHTPSDKTDQPSAPATPPPANPTAAPPGRPPLFAPVDTKQPSPTRPGNSVGESPSRVIPDRTTTIRPAEADLPAATPSYFNQITPSPSQAGPAPQPVPAPVEPPRVTQQAEPASPAPAAAPAAQPEPPRPQPATDTPPSRSVFGR